MTPTPISSDFDQLIHIVRGRRVMLDRDLARLYGVSTARLNQQVRRNRERFPEDFAFQLTRREQSDLMLQIATSNPGRGGSRKSPMAFSEHGALAAAFVLSSPTAVHASIAIVRAFVRLRELAAKPADLAAALEKLERQVRGQGARLDDHGRSIKALFAAIREIMEPPAAPSKQIGFAIDPSQ